MCNRIWILSRANEIVWTFTLNICPNFDGMVETIFRRFRANDIRQLYYYYFFKKNWKTLGHIRATICFSTIPMYNAKKKISFYFYHIITVRYIFRYFFYLCIGFIADFHLTRCIKRKNPPYYNNNRIFCYSTKFYFISRTFIVLSPNKF